MTPKTPKLEDDLRATIRRKHMSPRAEETYVQWYKRDDSTHPLVSLTPRGAA